MSDPIMNDFMGRLQFHGFSDAHLIGDEIHLTAHHKELIISRTVDRFRVRAAGQQFAEYFRLSSERSQKRKPLFLWSEDQSYRILRCANAVRSLVRE